MQKYHDEPKQYKGYLKSAGADLERGNSVALPSLRIRAELAEFAIASSREGCAWVAAFHDRVAAEYPQCRK